MDYCTVADLYQYGLQRGALANPGRLASSASASSNAFALDQHGFALNDAVTLRAESNGGALPAPLVAGVTYYVVPVNDLLFSVAASLDGAVIDLTTNGVRVVVGTQLPLAAAIRFGAALIDDMLPAHIVPLTAPFPPIVVMTNAELAIGKLTTSTGNGSKSLGDMVDTARARLARWAAGVPLRGENVPPAANLSTTAATAATRDCRGWRRWGTL